MTRRMRLSIAFTLLLAAVACTEPGPRLLLEAHEVAVAVTQRDTAAVSVTVSGDHLREPVRFEVTGLPAGVTASVIPATSATATHTVLLIADSVATPGVALGYLIAASGSARDSVSLRLTVAVRGSFALRLSPASQLVDVGDSPTSLTITVDRTGGFAQPVSATLSATLRRGGGPSGLKLTPETVIITGSSATVALDASSAALGTSVIKVTATSAGVPQAVDSVTMRLAAPFYVWPDTSVLFAGMTRQLAARSNDLRWYGDGPLTRTPDTWSSDNIAVATVDAAGVVTARQPGDATISAALKNRIVNVKVRVLPSPALRFSMVAGQYADPGHSAYQYQGAGCGLTADDGRLWCWGTPFPGDTGWFDRCEYTMRVGPLEAGFFRSRCGEIPRPVQTTLRFTSLTLTGSGAIGSQGCATATTGLVYCWGTNGHGQMGNGTIDGFAHPLTQVASSDRFASVVGGYSNRCALRIDGVVFCWGDQLNTPRTNALTPTRMESAVGFRQLGDPYCGLAADSTAYCFLQLPSDTVRRAQPVGGAARWIDVRGSCGLAANGRVSCWDLGTSGFPVTEFTDAPAFVSIQNGFLTANGDLYAIVISGTSRSLQAVDLMGAKLRQFSDRCGVGLDGLAYCFDEVSALHLRPWRLSGQ